MGQFCFWIVQTFHTFALVNAYSDSTFKVGSRSVSHISSVNALKTRGVPRLVFKMIYRYMKKT